MAVREVYTETRSAQLFLAGHGDVPPSQLVALKGSPRRVVWPPICPACGSPASTHIDVSKVIGRLSQYSGRSSYRSIVTMRVPFCRTCADRHERLLKPVPSVIGSFFRTPAILAAIGAIAVGAILWSIFVQGGHEVPLPERLDAAGGILLLVATGILLTWREARFLRVPPLTEITQACDFSGNVDYPLGRRRLYAIRHPACAEAFRTANQDRLSTRR
jgi:hypothetical protein